MKVIIGYGTWYGATSSTSEIIAEVLRNEGIEVDVVDLGRELIYDISEYALIVVGAGVRMGRWHGGAEKFIERHREKLAEKKVAIFVSAGGASIDAKKGDNEKTKDAYQKHLVKKAEKYSLNPISMNLFGGIFDYGKMGWLTRKLMSLAKKGLREAGVEEKDNSYDTRNLEEIKEWAKELAEKLKD